MNWVDGVIRDQRIAQATRFVRPGSRVFDIGCHDGALFRKLGPGLREGMGIDPDLAGPLSGPNYRLAPGQFPEDAPDTSGAFDAVCALAVLEHVPADGRRPFAERAARLAHPGGEVILTVPSPRVDRLLDALIRVGILDGMEADQHHGLEISSVEPIFTGAGLHLERHETFQLGLNHLFVFRKPPA